MANIVKKKKVTETREVEVEKVVLTLDEDQAAFLAAILYNTTLDSLGLVPGMIEVMREMKNGLPHRKYLAALVEVERSPYYNGNTT